MRPAMSTPHAERIEAAHVAIPPGFRDSPQFAAEELSEAIGARAFVKVESLNPIRSFKARGACWFAARRGAEAARDATGRKAGWVTGSAGNFGQGLAFAARRAGIPLTVFSAVRANPDKVAAMRRLGADVRLEGDDFDAAKEAGRAFAASAGATFVEDGREPEITEGAGTIALECFEADDPGDVLVSPVGNGALIGGMGLFVRRYQPQIRVLGVVAAAAPVMRRAWETGDCAAAAETPATPADGIAVRVPVPEAVAVMREVVDEVVEVSETALREAVRVLHQTLGLVVEPAGAAGVAAALEHPKRLGGRRLILPLCGGNAERGLLRECLLPDLARP